MQITVTVDVPEQIVQQSVENAVYAAFNTPRDRWDDNAGYGYKKIAAQVKLFCDSLDLSALIQEYANARVRDVVAEVVVAEMKKVAKQQSRSLFDAGDK